MYNESPELSSIARGFGGGWGIRTPEGLHPTRFPSVRHRPLGESSWRALPLATYQLMVYENWNVRESVGCYLGNRFAYWRNFAYTKSRLLTWRHLRLIPQGRNAARRPGSGGCVRSPFIFSVGTYWASCRAKFGKFLWITGIIHSMRIRRVRCGSCRVR